MGTEARYVLPNGAVITISTSAQVRTPGGEPMVVTTLETMDQIMGMVGAVREPGSVGNVIEGAGDAE